MGRSDSVIRRCWQEWVGNDIFQRYDGSGRSRATADPEDILIARSAVSASDSSLSTIRCTTRTRVYVHHDHSQMADRAKFTLALTATPPAICACTLSSQIASMFGSIRLKSC
ncbi:hypothetical protein TNCV_939081 [Trichonephila clavipes]|nr:hypothetical protein TNCV_939081 [Trichonephila clavipes]